MKALTVQQPWAWAIIHGSKDVENRSQAWSYRGPLVIHAGARWSERGAESPLVRAALDRIDEAIGVPADVRESAATLAEPGRHVLAAFVGVVDLVDVHPAEPEIETDSGSGLWATACCSSPWGQYDGVRAHLVLANPRPLPRPIPCRGRLGLWTPPPDTLDELREAL